VPHTRKPSAPRCITSRIALQPADLRAGRTPPWRCRLPHRRDREALPIRVRMIGLSVGRLREPVRPRATFAAAAQAPASAPSPLARGDAAVPGTCLGAHEWDLTDQFRGPDAVVEPPSRPPQERTHDLVHEHRFGHPRPPRRMRKCADGPTGAPRHGQGSTTDPAAGSSWRDDVIHADRQAELSDHGVSTWAGPPPL
jgi:hypothetical protein